MLEVSRGSVIASDLYDRLEAEGITRGQAKTAVTRLITKGTLGRAALRLGSGVTILRVADAKPSPDLVRRLYERGFYGRPALKALVDCLVSSHPAVTRLDVAKVAALEIGEVGQERWAEPDQLVAGLVEIGVLKAEPVRGPVTTAWVADRQLLRQVRADVTEADTGPLAVVFREKFRLQVARAIAEWTVHNGFAAQAGLRVAGERQPWVNYLGLPFDYFGLNYAGGIVRRDGRTPPTGRAIVGDVLLSDCVPAYADSFVRRVDQAAVRASQRPMSFVLCRVAHAAAFARLREAGVFVWTFRQIFGRRAAEALRDANAVLQRIARQQEVDPDVLVRVFEGLQNFEEFGHLKGKLFELMLGYFFQRRGYECRLSWQVERDRKKYDVDVSGRRAAEGVIVECKGIGRDKLVDHEQVLRHFAERTPAVRGMWLDLAAKGGPQYKTFRSVVATTGEFRPETWAALNSGAIAGRSDTDLELWDRARLLKELDDDKEQVLSQIVRKYY